MRAVLLVVVSSLILCFSGYASAQTLRAITQDGKLVILNPDGTWIFADEVGPKSGTTTGIKGQINNRAQARQLRRLDR